MKFGNLISGPLGTSVRNAGAAVYGAEASLGLTRRIALVGNVAYSQSGLEIGAPLIGGVSIGRSSVLRSMTGRFALRVPVGMARSADLAVRAGRRRLRAAILRHRARVSTHATNFAYNVGAGADVALAPRFGLQLMVKDYIGKFDAQEATGINVDTKTTHNLAVSAGLRLGPVAAGPRASASP